MDTFSGILTVVYFAIYSILVLECSINVFNRTQISTKNKFILFFVLTPIVMIFYVLWPIFGYMKVRYDVNNSFGEIKDE